MVDTREYEWSDITVNLAGRNVSGLRAIKYSAKQDKELLYGKGNKPMGIQRGNKDYSGSVSLLQSEYEALRLAAGGDILDMRCNIVVCYGNPSKGEPIVTDTLIGVEFTEAPHEWKQGDKFSEQELPIIYIDQK